jgi:two-component system, OmpR family, phosphate regulon response regulator PhoB
MASQSPPAPDARRVLIVEDDNHIAMAMEYLLSREGVQADHITSGAGAVARVRADRPALVLLDVMLPEVSGFDICQQIRADPTLAGVKVLMLTARGSAADLRRARDEGADAFLAKPFEVRDFRREVRRLLNLSGG